MDPSSDRPLFDQVAASVRRAIAEGELREGEKLPAAHEIAGSLGMNQNTVLRAYRTLRDEGLIELRRGRGAVVCGAVSDARLTGLVDDVLAEGARLGLGPSDIADLISRRDR
ncbi:GntR family transcriptional regulator [Nigerium massiliense]|uniref:GntR family transcriptional regulator n=1 Tax=Nigerium massiliense TaxID=1522317 RepID=UPI000A57584E|nr:GntR family transcriptional regulator [Nigerium massiliense]